jgi:hypothetical protein
MFQKQRGLAMNRKNLAKIYIIETKIVRLSPVTGGMGKRGIKKMPASASGSPPGFAGEAERV